MEYVDVLTALTLVDPNAGVTLHPSSDPSRRTCSAGASIPTHEISEGRHRPIARTRATRDILAALARTQTESLTEEISAPKKACIPVPPSRPILVISITLTSA
jgi:hypothetical protein